MNRKILQTEGGDNWTGVEFIVIRGGLSITVGDRTIPVGVPFAGQAPGVLETIHLCSYEQALALAWNFAAHVAAAGGKIEVRAEAYELVYNIKARVMEVQEDANP